MMITAPSKRLIAAAAALSSGAACEALAQSSVTVYGGLDSALVYANNQLGRSATYVRSGNLVASKIGFKGTEDLGDGMQAMFVLENGVDVNTGLTSPSGYAFSRQSYVGIGRDTIGTLTLGRQYTPYYLFVGGPLGPTNIATGATGAHPGDIDGLDTTIRTNSSMSYTSPAWSGVQVGALLGLAQASDPASSGKAFSAAIKYDVHPWSYASAYLKLRNGHAPGAWSPTASGSFSTSPINNGYLSAESVQYLAAAMRYTAGRWIVGAIATQVAYRPNSDSLFSETARFDTAGLLAAYQPSSAVFLGAAYSTTRARAANGITDPARYQQLSLEQTYSFSKRTALYLLEARQLVRGKTLGILGAGHQIDAPAMVGDSQNQTPSSDRNQTVWMFGLRHSF